MNTIEYAKWFSEACLLLDPPAGTNGRWQRGQAIAIDPKNVRRAGPGWEVHSQSGGEWYQVDAKHCSCLDGRAPVQDGVKWCKHRIAVSLWVMARRLMATVAAAKVSEGLDQHDARWRRSHWQVLDEGDGKMRDVYLKRTDTSHGEVVEAQCECGRLQCAHNARSVCRHVRRCVERLAEVRGMRVSWSWYADNATRTARLGGHLFRVVSQQSQHEVYGLAKEK